MVCFVDMCMVKPNLFHRHVVIDIELRVYKRTYNFEHSYRKFADGNYNKVYNMLSNYDWSQVYNNMLVDAAVDSLNAAMHNAMD
jgi:hypothetical protein